MATEWEAIDDAHVEALKGRIDALVTELAVSTFVPRVLAELGQAAPETLRDCQAMSTRCSQIYGQLAGHFGTLASLEERRRRGR